MKKIEEQITKLLEELKKLEKEIDNLEYEIQSYFYSLEIRTELEEQKRHYNDEIKKTAERIIEILKGKNSSIRISPLLTDQEKKLTPKQFAILLTIVERHQLIGNENSIKEIARFISRESIPYFSLKWELNELSTLFLNDQDITLFLFTYLDVFIKFIPIYKSEILFQNKELKEKLKERRKEREVPYDLHYEEQSIKDMEKLIEIDENCDKQILFAIGEKDIGYIRENIEDKNLIETFLQLAKNKNTYSKWLSNIINYYNQKENDASKKEGEDTAFQRMQQAIISEITDSKIYDLFQNYNNLLESPKVRMAILNAKTTAIAAIQDKLIQFLQIKEIRNALLQEDNIYQDFLLSQINRLSEEEYGKYTHIFDTIKESSESEKTKKLKLLNSFNNMEYIYFYDKRGIFTKVPTIFYQEFLNNIYHEKPLSLYSKETNSTLLCDEELINSYIQNRITDISLRIIEFGIENEIIWNKWLNEAGLFQEDRQYKIYQKSGNQTFN